MLVFEETFRVDEEPATVAVAEAVLSHPVVLTASSTRPEREGSRRRQRGCCVTTYRWS